MSILGKQTKKTSTSLTVGLLTILLGLYSVSNLAVEKTSQIIDQSNKEPWKVWRKDAELEVSYRTSKYNGLIEIKAQAQLASTLAGFISFIEDLTQLPHWLDNTESAKTISQNAINENTFITQFKGLWPIAARDIVVHTRYWQNDNLSLEIAVTDASETIALTKDIIRMQLLKAHWHIVPTNVNQISIKYQFIVDPKGNVPQWLTKPMTLNGIWTTLNNLRDQLPNNKWQQKNRVDIKEFH